MRFGRYGGTSMSPEVMLFLSAMLGVAAIGIVVRLLVRLGVVAPQNELRAWMKGVVIAIFVIILLLILLDEYVI